VRRCREMDRRRRGKTGRKVWLRVLSYYEILYPYNV
jgi:hypothetical protein